MASTPASNTKWFVLGREPLIAAAEIDAVLNIGENYQYEPPILKIDARFDPAPLIKRLGGTIKIAQELADAISENELKNMVLSELKSVEGKINFGLSFYSPTDSDLKKIKNLGLEIKKQLKKEGYSARYVENKEPALSSVTVQKNGLTGRGREFLIQPKAGGRFCLAKTEAVQPFEEFSVRDFGRPGRDDLSGMLPPKLAIILINLAQIRPDSMLLDPFCGSGTILSEAMLLGYKNLIASDNSAKAIADTKKNIEWIANKFSISNSQFSINFQISNVQNLSNFLHVNSVDAIVTEPYLGKPLRGRETKEELRSQIDELKKLYLEAFTQFHKILKPKGRVVFLIPRFKFKNEWLAADIKNEISQMGFNALPFWEDKIPLLYARPNQRVGREIWRFEKI